MFGYVWLLGSCLAQKLDKKNWSHGCKEVFGGLSQRDLSQNIPMMCTESSTRHQRNCPDQAQGCLFQSVLMTNYINYILNHSTVVLAHGFLWKAAVFFFRTCFRDWDTVQPLRDPDDFGEEGTPSKKRPKHNADEGEQVWQHVLICHDLSCTSCQVQRTTW